MSVSDHLKPGLTSKSRVKIMTVDVPNRRVEGVLKDGSMIHIAVWDVDNVFRWPVENEVWIVRRDNGIWMLDHRQQQANDQATQPITSLSPGEMKLDADVIFTARGARLASFAVARYAHASAGAVALDASAGSLQIVSLTANASSSTILNPVAGQVLTVQWIQGLGGSHSYVWPTACKFAGGAAPSASTTVGYTDAVTFAFDGAVWKEQGRAVAIR